MKLSRFFLVLPLLIAVPIYAQTLNPNIENITPDSRYTVHSDGTVTDNETRLMWQQCSLGQAWVSNGGAGSCTGTATSYTWDNALTQATTNNDYGYSDWRLPSIKELASLVAEDRYNPAINSTIFPRTPSSLYWSGSPYAEHIDDSLGVNFGDGNDEYYWRSYSMHGRLVRFGQ